MADTTSRDVVIDLGAGDGRIPIYAAKHFGAQAIGVELEANLVRLAREQAAAQGVSRLATFEQQDSLARRREVSCQCSATGAGSDDDDVVVLHLNSAPETRDLIGLSCRRFCWQGPG